MSWRDFFYFSKGERSALIILLCLITIAGIMLIVTDSSESKSAEGISETSDGIIRTDSIETITVSKSSSASAPQNQKTKPNQPKETVPERVKRLTSSRPSYTRAEKFAVGTRVELNSADTTILKKVPGIGSSFANRIVKYRNLLGGFYAVAQLGEVYGIDEDKYNRLTPWFTADASLINLLSVNSLSQDSLRKHPYINYQQAKVIYQLRRQKKALAGWENLLLLNEFTEHDKTRLQPYLSFE